MQVKKGNQVQTKAGDIFNVVDVTDTHAQVQNTEGVVMPDIPLEDIVRIVKDTYTAIKILKGVIAFFVALFKKNIKTWQHSNPHIQKHFIQHIIIQRP
jgi:uncharacterized membrane protein